MDSNGRQRTSIPGSSTFRRLPTFSRSPFRRSDKHASPNPDHTAQTADGGPSSSSSATSSKVSTFPSLARVVVDDSSLSSALFGTPISDDTTQTPTPITSISSGTVTVGSSSSSSGAAAAAQQQQTSSTSSSTPPDASAPQPILPPQSISNIGGGSGTNVPGSSSAPPSQQSDQTAMYQSSQQTPQSQHQQQAPLSPHPYKVPARNTSSGSGSTPLNVGVGLASSPSNFDLEPITYPAHLAQTTRPPPPEAVGGGTIVQPLTAGATGSSVATSASGAGSPNTATGGSAATSPGAPAVPARSVHRYHRDISALGSGTAALASAMNLTTSGLAANAVNTPSGPQSTGNSQSAATPSIGGSGFSQNGGGPSATTSSSSIAAQQQQASMTGLSQGSGDSTPTVGPSGSGQPSGVSRSSASRKASASTSGRRAASGTTGAEKDPEDGSADDVGKRRGEGTSRSRRPPKARERDHAHAANDDGENLLTPVLPMAKVPRAPASAMYFSPVAAHGRPPGQALRAHTGTLVGDRMWFLGGVDARSCWRGVASFDTESLQWSTVETHGESLPPLRAHTTTLVGDQLYIFGGGDGPTYSNDVWVFDTVTRRFSRPVIATPRANLPPPRRAHTTVLYRNFLVVFGGGNGQAALNDVWALDVSDPSRLTWHEWRTRGDVPQKKGYHTANLVGDKMIVFGGSDGHASFADVHVLNLQTLTWTLVNTEVKHNRLSHTATQVGSYLFVIGGHNGQTYAQDVLLFNLVTLAWEQKVPKGVPPPGRGYHVAVLHDGRIFISGGYNGVSVFDDLWALDLGAGAYLPQVTTFEVDENAEHLHPPAPPSKNGSRI